MILNLCVHVHPSCHTASAAVLCSHLFNRHVSLLLFSVISHFKIFRGAQAPLAFLPGCYGPVSCFKPISTYVLRYPKPTSNKNISKDKMIISVNKAYFSQLLTYISPLIVRLLVATLHVGMTGKQDGGYTQLA